MSGEDAAALRRRIEELEGLASTLWARIETVEAASKAKTDALARVAHELRTQVSALLGVAQLLLDAAPGRDRLDYVEMIRHSGESLLTLLNDLLDVAKIESGKLELEATVFPLRDTLRHAVESFLPAAIAKGLTLEVHLADGVPATAVGDPGRIRQVVMNLVGNAIKFTRAGRVSVEVEGASGDGGHELQVDVIDTGIGIPPHRREALFEPFVQADPSVARDFGGSGLGLSICRELVGLMGGRIWVDEGPGGVGSAFSFTIKLEVAPEATREGAAPGATPAASGRLLVLSAGVGDPGSILALAGRRGMAVDAAGDPRQALDLLSIAAGDGRPYHLVAVDLAVGFRDFVERMRRDPSHDSTHVVVITATGERGDAGFCRTHRVAGYLTKPVDGAEVERAFDVILSGPAPGELGELVTRHWLREHRAG
jgi:CheY-like chemotaxis protein